MFVFPQVSTRLAQYDLKSRTVIIKFTGPKPLVFHINFFLLNLDMSVVTVFVLFFSLKFLLVVTCLSLPFERSKTGGYFGGS